MAQQQQILLGQTIRDKISGYEGIATTRSEYQFGCPRVGIQPPKKPDGSLQEEIGFDEPQLEVVDAKRIIVTEPPAQRFAFGQLCTCSVTNYEGVLVGRAVYLNGCARVALQPKLVKGKELQNAMWFNEQQVEAKGKLIPLPKAPAATAKPKPGGPNLAPPRDMLSPSR